ncbi:MULTISPECIES: DNA starvation/stationary phase protection protein Dps [unclassified Paracoccus (in: a-proteobacteria)]|uniref:DNA starvation/stationary phase protection protein Dps n=1 Tax=unclassified Paracoccus (in: a-proteobacteria) TaxID=2688777 RepID=UPI001601F349|nr:MULTISPECIES: DNA starvation/stationary phase protection protein Dps [unclassified Paracoccus (in: a-proteobacteria)]MBB1490374.1 DNA starvation/stationary phase protection protein Dps [Paracoccus sp. MC1854]MBB1497216.1 DNA starvation/stationary phase protection protein Dps [Paracoccus sp. MC1862]QQO44810.1 DNA starvation/stationary phase protection protein Dps [Paracoccus sp. MC1862]
MPVNLQGLEDNARKTAISELQACMSDGLSLSLALKQAHWNLKGPNFIAVHELLDGIKARLDPNIDDMAERIQQLDGMAVGTVEEVARATALPPYPTDLTATEDHLREVADRLRAYGERVRKGIDTVDEAGDADSADILTEASKQADKDLWFIEAHRG